MPGLLKDVAKASSLIPHATLDQLAAFEAKGIISGGMRPKVEAAAGFVRAGGGRSVIAQLSAGPAALRGEAGTTIVRDT